MKVHQGLYLGAFALTVAAVENVVKLPLTKVKAPNSTRVLYRRDETHPETLVDDYYSYYADVQVGTPAQTIRVLVDTGSSDLWFPTSDNPHCPEGTATPIDNGDPDTDYCLATALFDTGASSTWEPNYNVPALYISYVDKGYARGTWGTDTLSWGDVTINEMYLAAANDSTKPALLGIGLVGGESTTWYHRRQAYEYANFPVRLQTDGYIAKTAYSLYMAEDPHTTDGDVDVTLLFGGVDNAKYSGSLATFPIVSSVDLAINLTGIEISVSGQTTTASTSEFKAVLDSGTTYQWLPTAAVNNLAQSLGSDMSTDQWGFYIVPCDYDQNDYISYIFGSKRINVPVSDVVLNYNSQCTLRIHGSDTVRPFLGDSFLINTYVLYNIDDNEISIAQARYTSEENIQAIS